MGSFLRELERLKPQVWRTIQRYLTHKSSGGYHEMVAEYPKRQGKYLRPGLLLLSAKMFGADQKDAMLTAAVIQTSEDWLLIHDDVEDHSLTRRSTKNEIKFTLNQIYGDELAINAGDGLHLIMWSMVGDIVQQSGLELGLKIYKKINQILLTTTEGQHLELLWIKNKKVLVTEAEYFEMVYKKTANYSIIGPLQLGATLAGKNNNEIKNIATWGKPFGLAFQVYDDVLNLTQKSSILGKEQAGDITEGKRTLILIHALNSSTTIEKAGLVQIYSKAHNEKTAEEKQYVLDIFKKYKSIDYAHDTATKLSRQAQKLFIKGTRHLPRSKEKNLIYDAIEFIIKRSY